MQTFYAFDKHGNFRPCSAATYLDSGWGTDDFAELFAGPLALKLYADGEAPPDAESRLQALLHFQLSAYYTVAEDTEKRIKFAWPQEILYESTNRYLVLGFSLPVINAAAAINLLSFHNTEARKTAGFSSKVNDRLEIARSLVAAIAELNATQIYVPNLNNRNVFVYKNHQVAIVDCDGFGFNAYQQYYPGGAVDPDICAPAYFEQARAAEEIDIAQERFALGILLFQLLNSGIHPFDGDLKQGMAKSDFPDNRQERMAAGYYAYGVIAHPMIAPVAVGSSHEYFPLELHELFARCFLGPANSRPDSVEWLYYLAGLDERALSHDGQKQQPKTPVAFVSVLADPAPETAPAEFSAGKSNAWFMQRKFKGAAIVLVVLLLAAGSLWQLPYIQALVSQNLHIFSPGANPQQTPSALYEIIQNHDADSHQPPVDVPVSAKEVDELKQSGVVAVEIPHVKRTINIKQSKVISPNCKRLLDKYQLTGEGEVQYLKECSD